MNYEDDKTNRYEEASNLEERPKLGEFMKILHGHGPNSVQARDYVLTNRTYEGDRFETYASILRKIKIKKIPESRKPLFSGT